MSIMKLDSSCISSYMHQQFRVICIPTCARQTFQFHSFCMLIWTLCCPIKIMHSYDSLRLFEEVHEHHKNKGPSYKAHKISLWVFSTEHCIMIGRNQSNQVIELSKPYDRSIEESTRHKYFLSASTKCQAQQLSDTNSKRLV